MMIMDQPQPPIPRPAARDDLAAAGPVEPSSSPDLAPGPTLSPPPDSRPGCFCHRKSPELVGAVRELYRRGENFAHIARSIAVAPDTARRWLDPVYDIRRRCRSTAGQTDSEGDLPTLPFIPGIVVSGRYRMKPPS